MDWIEVEIYTATAGIEAVCGRLMMLGVNGAAIRDAKDFNDFLNDKTGNWDYIDDDLMNLKNCETCVTVYLANNEQGTDTLAAIRSSLAELKSLDTDKQYGRLEITLKNVNEEDWANNWKKYFKPFTIGEKLAVKPSWENYDNPEGRTVVEIDPASSFGSGQHNTTQLCLELIEKNLHENDRILDLGCGSGILSIAGVLLGAKDASAVDIDSNSVKVAMENAVKNHIPESIYKGYFGNIIGDEKLRAEIGGGYNLISANIVADVIIAMSPIFKDFLVSNGIIIISGIIVERCDEVLDVMKNNGYIQLELRESNGWAAASFTI